MTLEEKCTLIHGVKGEGEYEDGFHIMPIPRLGIPAIRMATPPTRCNRGNFSSAGLNALLPVFA